MENETSFTTHCGCRLWVNKRGRFHRLDGPAIERNPNCGIKPEQSIFWINGVALTEEEYLKRIEEMRQDVLERLEEAFVKCYIWTAIQQNFELYDLVCSYERQLPHFGVTGERSDLLNEYLSRKKILYRGR